MNSFRNQLLKMRKLKFFYTVLIAWGLINFVSLDITSSNPDRWISTNLEASAKSSGGRSRGGSFRRSSPSRSSSGSRGSSSSGSRRSNGNYNYSNPSYGGHSSNYGYSGYRNSNVYLNSAWAKFLLFLILALILIVLVMAIAQMFGQWKERRSSGGPKELANDIVTVSKLQVALLAIASQVQKDISELIRNADLSTSEGLTQQLQAAALILLRNSESWTHVLASSQTVKSREAAERLFNELSIEERSKFSCETLSNVNGQVTEAELVNPEADEIADYIVVTFLVGTEDDKPLFAEINSFTELEAALKKLAAITPDYLLTFELSIAPQEASDCLTYDELLTEYTDMRQLV